jgi:GDP-L-fucose synthase
MLPFDPAAANANLKMFANLYAARGCFGRLIQFGSGAEFDRSRHIFNAREEDLFLSAPIDHYGMSKNICSRIAFDTDNFYTLRLFGVFHHSEPAKRLLPRVLSKEPTVLEDKYFDYIYLEDILPVIEYYIEQATPKFKDINLVYPEKTLLSYFVQKFCDVNKIDDSHVTISAVPGLNYTGSSVRIQELNLPMLGMEQGFERY